MNNLEAYIREAESHGTKHCLVAVDALSALLEIAEAARPIIRGLELVQEHGEPKEKAWRMELKLQQALSQLDKARQG